MNLPFARFHALASSVLCAALCAPYTAATATAGPDDRWPARLEADLARLSAHQDTAFGVYVRDLDTGVSASWRGDRRWYLASMVKVPVAIAVLRGVERGDYELDTRLTLRAGDYVDGAGFTNGHAVGAPLTIRFLLEQMIIYSDNTASDMLIDLVGIASVNATARSLVPEGIAEITSLADVRREVYSRLTPAARRLSGVDFLAMRKLRTDGERLQMLSRLTGTPVADFKLPTLNAAYDAYYASGLNVGRLDAHAELLALLADGKALDPVRTDYLLGVMARTATGPNRLKAGLPARARFAHKTGTQRRRTCDGGIVTVPRSAGPQRVVIVACTSGENSSVRSDLALRQVGMALCRSGLITSGVIDAPSCPVLPRAEPLPAAAPRR